MNDCFEFTGTVRIIGYGLYDPNSKTWYYEDSFSFGFKENLQFILESEKDFFPILKNRSHLLKERTLDIVPILVRV